jgi:hypothetical protein
VDEAKPGLKVPMLNVSADNVESVNGNRITDSE